MEWKGGDDVSTRTMVTQKIFPEVEKPRFPPPSGAFRNLDLPLQVLMKKWGNHEEMSESPTKLLAAWRLKWCKRKAECCSSGPITFQPSP